MILSETMTVIDFVWLPQSEDWKFYFTTVVWVNVLVIWIALAYKFGDWRNWRKYYPTILFFLCGNFIYNIIFHDKLLWKFTNPFFSHIFTDMLDMAIVFPCTILLFLPHYPQKTSKRFLYLIFWIFIYSFVEWGFYTLGGIVYFLGWTLWWSVIHNAYQFILLKVHHKRPILAWTLSLTILFIIMSIFNVSII